VTDSRYLIRLDTTPLTFCFVIAAHAEQIEQLLRLYTSWKGFQSHFNKVNEQMEKEIDKYCVVLLSKATEPLTDK